MGDEHRSSGSERRTAAGKRVCPAVLAALDAARGRGQLDAADEPGAAVAVALAGLVDQLGVKPRGEKPADRARRTADVVRVAKELRETLSGLPLRPASGGDDGNSGSAAGDAGAGRSVDDELADLLGSGPSVGDPALT